MIQIQEILIWTFENIQLQEQYIVKISSKNNMHTKKLQVRIQPTFSQNTNFSLFKGQNPNIQRSNQESISTLDNDQTPDFSHLSKENSHQAFCNQAQQWVKTQNYTLAFEMCIKAVQYLSNCTKCLSLYLQLFDIILPRKLPFLDTLLKRCQKGQISDPSIAFALKKIKESQNLDQDYQDLLKDLEENGAEFSKLSILSQNFENRTIIARSQVQKDQTLLFIPKNKLILLENARDSQIVKKVRQQRLYLGSPKHCQLTIYLLEEQQKGELSAFWLYLKHLPENFDTFPINYKPEELNYLKGSPFLDQVEQKKIDIQRDYNAICSVCPEFRRFQYEDFKRFRLIVSSRLFGVSIGKLRTDALVPLADMLNHNIPKQTSWFYSDQYDGFLIKSTKKIQKGEQIFDSYGPKCNSRFLLNYGFTMPQNDVNEVTIKVPFEYEQDDRTQIYRQINVKISMNIEGNQFEELLSILRHSIIQQFEVNRSEVSMDKIKETRFVSLDVESQIWQKLEKIVESQLQSYPTTLKEDRKLLLSKDLSTNYFNCLILRLGQKQILHFYLTMSRKLVKYFRTGSSKRMLETIQEYQSYLKKLNFS